MNLINTHFSWPECVSCLWRQVPDPWSQLAVSRQTKAWHSGPGLGRGHKLHFNFLSSHCHPCPEVEKPPPLNLDPLVVRKESITNLQKRVLLVLASTAVHCHHNPAAALASV